MYLLIINFFQSKPGVLLDDTMQKCYDHLILFFFGNDDAVMANLKAKNLLHVIQPPSCIFNNVQDQGTKYFSGCLSSTFNFFHLIEYSLVIYSRAYQIENKNNELNRTVIFLLQKSFLQVRENVSIHFFVLKVFNMGQKFLTFISQNRI